MKTTEQLIQELSLQSTKIKSISFTDISLPFFIRTGVYSIITFMMIMKWGEVGSKLISLSFIAESILMLSACLFTLGLTYFAAIPSKLKNKHLYLLGGLFFIIITSIFFRFNLSMVSNLTFY